jgi:hypothetical protein
MGAWQILLEVALIGLLGVTLFHALRLERALGVVRRDRAELETLLRGFNDSTHQAESAIERLRGAAEGAGRHVARQIEGAVTLKEDLLTLIDRGERVADRLDTLIRTSRDQASPQASIPTRRYPAPAPEPEPAEPAGPRVRSQAERDLLRALRVSR